jgi:hypothetical protein
MAIRQGGIEMNKLWDRWAPLSGVVSVACAVVGTLMVLNQPQTKDSDATIVAYFASHSHRAQGIAGFLVFVAGVLLLLVFLSSLRGRLLDREGGGGRLASLTFGAGIGAATLWVVSMLLANATTFAASEGHYRVDPNTFRLLGDTAYAGWIAALAVGAVIVWGTSVAALRTGVLPRWFAILGAVVGVSMLFGYFFFPFFAWWIWVVLASILLVRRAAPEPRTALEHASATS